MLRYAKSLQSCPTLCDPIDDSLPGSPVPGILQARTLEWVAIAFSSAWKWKVKVKSLSRVRLLATPWTAAFQAPPSMGFSRQEYWSGVPLPSPAKEYKSYLLIWAHPHSTKDYWLPILHESNIFPETLRKINRNKTKSLALEKRPKKRDRKQGLKVQKMFCGGPKN